VSYENIVICSHAVAEQVTKASATFRYGVGKSPSVSMLEDVLGLSSIFSVNVCPYVLNPQLFMCVGNST
jgi:hypothetical protein